MIEEESSPKLSDWEQVPNCFRKYVIYFGRPWSKGIESCTRHKLFTVVSHISPTTNIPTIYVLVAENENCVTHLLLSSLRTYDVSSTFRFQRLKYLFGLEILVVCKNLLSMQPCERIKSGYIPIYCFGVHFISIAFGYWCVLDAKALTIDSILMIPTSHRRLAHYQLVRDQPKIWVQRNFQNRSHSLVVVWLLPSQKQPVIARECLPAFTTFYYGNVAPTEKKTQRDSFGVCQAVSQARSSQRKSILLFSRLKGNVKVKWNCVDVFVDSQPQRSDDFGATNGFAGIKFSNGVIWCWNGILVKCMCSSALICPGTQHGL